MCALGVIREASEGEGRGRETQYIIQVMRNLVTSRSSEASVGSIFRMHVLRHQQLLKINSVVVQLFFARRTHRAALAKCRAR